MFVSHGCCGCARAALINTILNTIAVFGHADEVMPAVLDLTDAVLLGRQDFTVRSFDAVLGHEKWNVTYAELKVRPLPQLAQVQAGDRLPPADAVNAGMSAKFVVTCTMYSIIAYVHFAVSDSFQIASQAWHGSCCKSLIDSELSMDCQLIIDE